MHRLDTFLATTLSEAEGSVASFMALRALINRFLEKKILNFKACKPIKPVSKNNLETLKV